MKTTVKIVLIIALITTLCGCTAKADEPTATPEPTETVSAESTVTPEPTGISTSTSKQANEPEAEATTSESTTADQASEDTEESPTATPVPTATPAYTPVPTSVTAEPAETEPPNASTSTPEPATPQPTATPVPETVLSKPTISLSTTEMTRDPITVTINAPAEATMVKYQIDNLGFGVYTGSFTVTGNCTITAFAATHTEMSETATRTITNYDSSPEPTPELTVSSAGSSYMQEVASAMNAAKEAEGLGTFTVSYGGQIQTDAENILLGVQAGPSGLANWIRGNYSGTGAGNALASGNLMGAANINIGAAKSSTGEYCVCVAYW